MWLLLWATFCVLVPFLSCSVVAARDLPAATQQEAINNFKIELQHTLEGSRIRRKRQAGLMDTISEQDAFKEDHYKVSNSTSEDLPYLDQSNLTTWTSMYFLRQQYVFAGHGDGTYILLDVADKPYIVSSISGQVVGQKCRAFSFAADQWFIVLQSEEDKTWIQMYQREGRDLVSRQRIMLTGDSNFDLITLRGIHYMAVTSVTRVNKVYFSEGKIRLFAWAKTQFDEIAERTTYGATSVVSWSMDGALYMAVSQEINDSGNIYIGSPVFIFNSRDKDSLILSGLLKTKGPKKVAHFFVSGSQYLIFIGRKDAEIYWWSHGQFLLWQTIEGTADASDVSSLALWNGEVILSIVLKEKVLFYTLDATGYYIETFAMQFHGFHIHSLQYMFDSRNFYVLVLPSALAAIRPEPVWKLSLKKYKLPTLSSVDPLLQCLSSLKAATVERGQELEAIQFDMDRVWMSDKEQVLQTKVIVQGSISSPKEKSKIELIVISSNFTSDVSPADLKDMANSVSSSKQIIEEEFPNIVMKSVDQNIYGSMNFMNAVQVESLSIPTVNMSSTINGIAFDRLATQTLKNQGDQTFSEAIQMDHLSVDSSSIQIVNGMDVNDFALLDGSYTVPGNWQFSSLSSGGLQVETVNSISLSDVVLKDTDQTVTGLKTFNNFISNDISVERTVNDKYLREFVGDVVTLDTDQVLDVKMNLMAVTNINNLTVDQPINGEISLTDLDTLTVRKSVAQSISGLKTFLSDVHVLGDIDIGGLDFDKQYVTKSGSQTITGNIYFQDVSFADIINNYTNGINWNKDVVLKGKDQVIEGHKTFKSLTAGSVDLSEGVMINDIDLSLAASTWPHHQDGVISNIPIVFGNVVVLRDLTAVQGINGFMLSDLSQTVWLKSQPQAIDVPITMPNSVTFSNDLEARLVNGLDLTTDVVHVLGNDTTSGELVFADDVRIIKNIDVLPGKLLAGIDFTAFKEDANLDEMISNDLVYGIKTFKSLEVIGDIYSSNINGINFVDSIMQPDKPQQVDGDMSFEALTMEKNLFGRNIYADVFNDLPFREFNDNVVYKNHIIDRPILNKKFLHLEAKEVSMFDMAQINGIPFIDMVLKTVSLNTPQFIPSRKNFSGPVHFGSSVSTKSFNGYNLPEFINSIVFTDEPSVVYGGITFNGPVFMENINVGLLNDVNVTKMASKAVSKSADLEILHPVSFKNSLNIGTLYVENSLLDGISLEYSKSTKENLTFEEPVTFSSSVTVLGNVFTKDNVNDCPLRNISEFGLRSSYGKSQTFLEDVEIGQLTIDGNVNFKSKLNEVPLQELKDIIIGDKGYQVIAGDLEVNSDIFVENLFVKGFMNDVDLAFVMEDAVTKTTEQNIFGEKTFFGDVEADILTGEIDMTLKETVNSVNVDVLQNIVTKSGFQFIQGDKIFKDLSAKDVKLFEYLNGIKLPGDVILANESEVLPASVVIDKDVEIHSDLYVDGTLDGVILNDVNNLVSLTDNEVISLDITFTEDVTIQGELTVDGTINDIPLEMVVKVFGENIIDGRKEFGDSLIVAADVNASLVNGLNLGDFSSHVASCKSNEALTSQTFVEPIYIQKDLNMDFLNGISLDGMTSNFSRTSRETSETLKFFKATSSRNKDILSSLMESSEGQGQEFAYFSLHQELNLGFANRILSGLSELYEGRIVSSSMVMWINKQECVDPSRCCQTASSYWLTIDQTATTSIASGPSTGRYFPMLPVNPAFLARDERLVVWSNSTFLVPEWCFAGHRESAIGLLDDTGTMTTLLKLQPFSMLVDILSFRDEYLYIVAAYYQDSRSSQYSATIVYRGSDSTNKWIEYQILSTYGALSMDMVVYTPNHGQASEILLAVGSGMGTYPNSNSSIYLWDTISKSFELIEAVISQYVASILWIRKGDALLLAVANIDELSSDGSPCGDIIQGGHINIYAYEGRTKPLQDIRLPAVVSMVSFQIFGETYLAAASKQLQLVVLFQWQGYNGFVEVQKFEAKGVEHLNVLKKNEDLYMTVASSTGTSKILKAFVRGQKTNYKSLKLPDPSKLEDSRSILKDQPQKNDNC